MSGGTPQDPSDEQNGHDPGRAAGSSIRTPHRTALWRAIFVVVVALGIAATVLGVTTGPALSAAGAHPHM